jgi:hypothetical protein
MMDMEQTGRVDVDTDLEPENQPAKKPFKPKAISHVAVVHCNYGKTDALVVFYAEGNIDKEVSCEKVLCEKHWKGEKRAMLGTEVELGKGCWITNNIHRTFID